MIEKEEKQELIEAYILGAAMNDPYSLQTMLSSLSSADFFFHEHRHIFQAIKILYGDKKNPDLNESTSSVFNYMKTVGIDLPPDKIMNISLSGKGADINYYISEIKESAFRSRAYGLLLEAAKKIEQHENPSSLMSDLKDELSELSVYNADKFVPFSKILNDYKKGKPLEEVIQDEQEQVALGNDIFDGFRTGYKNLDGLIGGFQNGTNNIIGARSSSGKTTFLINLIMNLHERYKEKVKIGFFSLEMTKQNIVDKIICTVASVPYKKYSDRNLTSEEYQRIVEAANGCRDWELYFFNSPSVSIHKMQTSVRYSVLKYGINFVMTDYLTLIQTDKKLNNRHLEIDQISKAIQGLAIELNIPFLTLAQLNRNVGNRSDKKPVITDLRESGSIEEDADTVLLMHRPAHYTEKTLDNTEIFTAKNRLRGELGKTEYRFENGRLIEVESVENLRPNEVITPEPEKNKNWQARYDF